MERKNIFIFTLLFISLLISITGFFVAVFAEKELVLVDCFDDDGNNFFDEKCEEEEFVDKNLNQIMEILLTIVILIIMTVFISFISFITNES